MPPRICGSFIVVTLVLFISRACTCGEGYRAWYHTMRNFLSLWSFILSMLLMSGVIPHNVLFMYLLIPHLVSYVWCLIESLCFCDFSCNCDDHDRNPHPNCVPSLSAIGNLVATILFGVVKDWPGRIPSWPIALIICIPKFISAVMAFYSLIYLSSCKMLSSVLFILVLCLDMVCIVLLVIRSEGVLLILSVSSKILGFFMTVVLITQISLAQSIKKHANH